MAKLETVNTDGATMTTNSMYGALLMMAYAAGYLPSRGASRFTSGRSHIHPSVPDR